MSNRGRDLADLSYALFWGAVVAVVVAAVAVAVLVTWLVMR